jgi:hypothetical protein
MAFAAQERLAKLFLALAMTVGSVRWFICCSTPQDSTS